MLDRTGCPTCGGKGRIEGVAIACGASGSSIHRNVLCTRCHGSGWIPTAMLRWIERGMRWREARLTHREGLTACARRLGLTVSTLSDLEHGRMDNAERLGGGYVAPQ